MIIRTNTNSYLDRSRFVSERDGSDSYLCSVSSVVHCLAQHATIILPYASVKPEGNLTFQPIPDFGGWTFVTTTRRSQGEGNFSRSQSLLVTKTSSRRHGRTSGVIISQKRFVIRHFKVSSTSHTRGDIPWNSKFFFFFSFPFKESVP